MSVTPTDPEPESHPYFLLIEYAPVAMVLSDETGRIVLANHEAESLFGYSRVDLIGQQIEFLVPERFRRGHPNSRNAYVKKPEPRIMGLGRDLYALHKSGAEVPVEIGLRPVQTSEGTFVLNTISDITERRQIQQATGRLAAIVQSAHVAMIAYSTDGIITDWNPAAQLLYGYSEEEIVGESLFRIIPGDLKSQIDDFIERVSRGETIDYVETDRLRKSGERVRVSLTLSPIQDSSGEIIGISGIARDITERVALQQQLSKANEKLAERTERLASQARRLQEANQALEQSNQELAQFAYVASHDLQAPLRSINGFLQLLRDDYSNQLDGQAQDWIRRVLDSVAKLQSLITDLLSYARVESQGQPFSDVDLSVIFDDTARLFDGTVSQLRAQISRDDLPVVRGDPAQLGRVFENLIDNALKYHGTERPTVHAGVEEDENFWRLSVRDNGIGIDPQFHGQIFDVFRRLHTDADYPGTGIGLALCRRVIQRHSGVLWLESSEGRGSTFIFTLPKPEIDSF